MANDANTDCTTYSPGLLNEGVSRPGLSNTQNTKENTMSNHELTDLDYSFHIDDEAALDEPWMYDQEVSRMLADIDAEFPDEVFE